MNSLSNRSTRLGILIGIVGTIVSLLGIHTILAQGETNEWILPEGHLYTTFPYYARVANVNVILYGRQHVPMDVDGDGLVDWVYKDDTTEFVSLNDGTGWERVYSCRFRSGVWLDDCTDRNPPEGAAALSVASEPCTYIEDAGYWQGDCQFIPR